MSVEELRQNKIEVDVLCALCKNPLKWGRIVCFLRGDVLGTRIVIECKACGKLHRFKVKRR